MNPPKFRFFIAVTAGFLLQNALSFIFPQVVPPFLLMAVVFYALYQGAFFGLVMGCYGGLLLDLLGTGPLGLEMLIYGLLGLLASATASKVFRESVLTRMVLPVLCEYAATCLNLIYYKANVPGETLSIGILAEGFVPGELLLVAVFSPFIFSLLKRFSYPEEGRRASRLVMRN